MSHRELVCMNILNWDKSKINLVRKKIRLDKQLILFMEQLSKKLLITVPIVNQIEYGEILILDYYKIYYY